MPDIPTVPDTPAAPLAEGPVGWRFKALPPQAAPHLRETIPARGYRLLDDSHGFEWPVMVLKQTALDANLHALADYCTARGALLAPHGKTALSPDLYRRQQDAGAWAVSVATPHQARVYRAGGARRILYANPLVHGGFASWAQQELAADPEFGFTAYVDSPDGARLLGEALDPDGPPLPVLVEIGHHGGRTGCRTTADVLATARAAAAQPALAVAGTAAYEGSVSHARDPEALDAVAAFLRTVRTATEALATAQLLDPRREEYLVSAGGSIYYDVVARELADGWRTVTDRPVRLVLRSGAYLAHDSGLYDRLAAEARPHGTPPLSPAIEVWTQVLSTPEPGLALLDAGRRDLPFDEGLPVPLTHRPHGTADLRPAAPGWHITALNDQHAFLRHDPAAGPGPAVGDLLALGISHPCTAHDKWQLAPIVDDEYRVVDTARCYF